jgi:hypothetical protein
MVRTKSVLLRVIAVDVIGVSIETMLIEHGEVQTQGRNIRHYTNYLTERARSFRDTKCDFVRGAEGRLEKLSVEKGLLRETESVQHQITALLKCDVCPPFKFWDFLLNWDLGFGQRAGK